MISIPKIFKFIWFFAPRKGIQIPEAVNFCSWNPESWARESAIPLTIGIPNPSSTEEESGIQFLEWTPESKTVLNSLKCGDQFLYDFTKKIL